MGFRLQLYGYKFSLMHKPTHGFRGAGMIVSHYVRCQRRGVRLVAVGVSSRVVQLLELTKVDKLFPRFDSVEEADRA
jgi:anti-anti-sigma regulatory factor